MTGDNRSGQERSRMIRLINNTGRRFLASKNQIQLAVVEFGDLGHQIGSFSPTQNTNIGQLKVNDKVMCHMSMMLPAMFDQNPPHTFDKIVENRLQQKMLSKLHLYSKCQGRSRIQKTMTLHCMKN